MTKKEYIDFIRNSLPMVDKTSKYHRNQVSAAINVAVNQAFWDMYDGNKKMFKKSLERYTTVITKTPTVNATTSRYETTTGVDVVDLPRKTGGVIEIVAPTTTTTKFVPISTVEGNQFYGAEASLPGNVIGFSWDGAQAVEFWDMSAAEASATVMMRVIQQFREYADSDNVVLPYGQDERIIELVRQFLGVIPPKDIVNNNADIQTNG